MMLGWFTAMMSGAGITPAVLPEAYVATPGAVTRLTDRNGDDDWLDAFETLSYAINLPAGISALAIAGEDLFVLDPIGTAVYRLRDENGDGDAFDAGEVILYAQPPPASPPAELRSLTRLPGTRLLSLDVARGDILLFEDLNGDGDALDFAERRVAAQFLSDGLFLTGRPDGTALVSRQNASIGVSLLIDRNHDGDFLDFAENLSYIENAGTGGALSATTPRVAFMLRPADGFVVKLQDLTGDGDALDFGEVGVFATPQTGATALHAINASEVYVAGSNGRVHRLWDVTQDGDALDVGESLLVADNLSLPRGIVLRETVMPCQAGDVTGDGAVDLADVQPFADLLLGQGPAIPWCRADMNEDGQLNGKDIQLFTRSVSP